MFDLKKSSPLFVAKLGCAVTIFVLLSACSSEQVQMDVALIPPPIENVTHEPDSSVKPPTQIKSQGKKSRRVARHKVKKHRGAALAQVAKAEVNGPPPATAASASVVDTVSPTLPIPAPLPEELMIATPTEQSKDFWALWLGAIVLSTGGLLWFALRRTSVGGRKSGRRLIFNS